MYQSDKFGVINNENLKNANSLGHFSEPSRTLTSYCYYERRASVYVPAISNKRQNIHRHIKNTVKYLRWSVLRKELTISSRFSQKSLS